jgi:hypothetical protein
VLTLALKRNKIAFVLFASSVLDFAVLQLLASGWLLRVGL